MRSIFAVSLVMLACAGWCFYLSAKYFDAGIMYVAVGSSNPNPPESAKVIGQFWMDKSSNWLWAGIGVVVLLVIWLVASIEMLRRTRLKTH